MLPFQKGGMGEHSKERLLKQTKTHRKEKQNKTKPYSSMPGI